MRKTETPPTKNKTKNVTSPLRPSDSSERTHATGREIGGPSGPEPTRFGDWERRGRCIDF
ncbi:MAG: DUF1674 domain-containing protein [Gammaproteobacteria bacterium]|jgi:hypothetical protein|nr:DUF1674 domain-containing protein [Gammaproteobacteria bacterium]